MAKPKELANPTQDRKEIFKNALPHDKNKRQKIIANTYDFCMVDNDTDDNSTAPNIRFASCGLSFSQTVFIFNFTSCMRTLKQFFLPHARKPEDR